MDQLIQEFLIQVVDRGTAIDGPKAGDTIHAAPYLHAWSEAERRVHAWRIVRAPVLRTHTKAMMVSPQHTRPGPGRHPRKVYAFDFNRLSPERRALFIGRRTQEIIELTREEFVAASIIKERVE